MSAGMEQLARQGYVIGIGLCDEKQAIIGKLLPAEFHLEHLNGLPRLKQRIELGFLQCNVALIDSSIENPISASQLVHSFDKTIPVLILASAENCAAIRRSVMYAPLLGNEVTPWCSEDLAGLVQAIVPAAERHRQRRKYLDTFATVQPRLGNLTLSQPELGHYLDRLLNQAPIGVVGLDSQSCIQAINRQARQLLGVGETEAVGVPLAGFFTAQWRDQLLNLLARSKVAQVFGAKTEVLERSSGSGQMRFLEASASPIAYQAERRGFMVILQDVTERERAERQRKKNEALMLTLSSALQQAAEAVMITDSNRVISYVNPAFESLTGYSREEAIGRKTYFLRSGVHDKVFYGKLWETIRNGSVYRGVVINRKKDGQEYHEEKTITPLRNSEGVVTHYVSTGHDISDRLKAEKEISRHKIELTHVSRLSTLGEMTSGLAHELNQPLCAITTYAQTCLRVIDNGGEQNPKLRYGLEQVVKQAELANEILKRLRNFARKRSLPKRCVDLRDIAKEVANLSASELNEHGIELMTEQQDQPLATLADPIQIEQVLLNLLRNSIDAMQEMPAERKKITLVLGMLADQSVKVSLSDSGPGCSAEIAERLFEPFYTTKPNGLGIGLGISQSIIEAHGGRLILERNDHTGVTFSFSLPAFKPSGADDKAVDSECQTDQQEGENAGAADNAVDSLRS